MKTSLKNLQTIVNQVNQEYKNTDKRDRAKIVLVKAKLAVLAEIVQYVKSFEWLKHEDYKSMIADFFNSKFDYSVLRYKYNLSKKQAVDTISYANNKLREKLGEDTLDLISKGDIETARKQFYSCSERLKLGDYMLNEPYELLPVSSFNPVDLNEKEAKEAFDFIKTYSRAEMKRRFENIDKKVLSYVLYVLEGKSEKQKEKFNEYIDILFGMSDNENETA